MTAAPSDVFAEMNRKLDVLIGLTASAGRDEDTQIKVLSALGYGPAFIGPLVNMTPNTVAARLSRQRRSKAPKTRRKG